MRDGIEVAVLDDHAGALRVRFLANLLQVDTDMAAVWLWLAIALESIIVTLVNDNGKVLFYSPE